MLLVHISYNRNIRRIGCISCYDDDALTTPPYSSLLNLFYCNAWRTSTIYYHSSMWATFWDPLGISSELLNMAWAMRRYQPYNCCPLGSQLRSCCFFGRIWVEALPYTHGVLWTCTRNAWQLGSHHFSLLSLKLIGLWQSAQQIALTCSWKQ